MQCVRLIDPRRSKQLFLLCWLAYFSTYIGRYHYSAAMVEMIAQNVLTKVQAGSIATVYFFIYGVGQLISGIISDRVNPYRMVSIGIFGAALCNVALFFLHSYHQLLLFWGLNGFFQSMVWAPVLKLLVEVLPCADQKKACINISTTMAVGTLTSYLLASFCLSQFPWTSAFLAAGLFMAAAGCLWHFGSSGLRCNTIVHSTQKASLQHQGEKPAPLPKLLLLSGTATLLLPVAAHGMLKDGVTAWTPTYLSEVFSLPTQLCALLVILLPIVNVAGAYVAAFLDKHIFHNEYSTISALFFVSLLSVLLLKFVSGSALLPSLLLISVVTSSMFGINTLMLNIIPAYFQKYNCIATISGLFNAIAYLGCSVSNYAVGVISEEGGWSGVFVFWGGLCLLSILICTYSRNKWKHFSTNVIAQLP